MGWEFKGRTRPLAGPLGFVAVLGAAGALHAETLADALSLAYQSNPTLQQARAQQRALDESSVQARAGWRPTIGITASDDYEKVFQSPSVSVNTGGASIGITQPIYTSGRTGAAVRSADAGIEAGRENLRGTEAQVLFSVVQAFEDVLRDQTLLAVRRDDVTALRRVLDEVTARRQVGQITRTDVLQIQTQLSAAQSALSAAEGQLQNSRAAYAAVVGQNPGSLVAPTVLPQIPKDVDAAFNAAEQDNPTLRAAKFGEQSSREKIAQARAGLGPQVSVGAQYGYSGATTPAQTIDYNRALTAQVTLSQPLFSGGLTSSLIRQAIQQNEADRVGVEKARRQVIQGVAQAWNQVISLERQRAVDHAAVETARLELEGMQEEYKVAVRTTLEVLSADQALRAAEVTLATVDHDSFLAEATLLGYIGKLEARYLTSGEPLYDPRANYKKVRSRGATPLDPIVSALDSLSIGHVGALPPVDTPPPPPTVVAVAPGVEPDPDAPLATASPERTPGYVALSPPPRVMAPPSPKTRRRLDNDAMKDLSQPEGDARAPTSGNRSEITVQVGSYPTQAMAEEEWRTIHEALPDEVEDKDKVIETATLEGVSVFRTLVAGFATEGAAIRFCEALKSKGRDCLVRGGKSPRSA